MQIASLLNWKKTYFQNGYFGFDHGTHVLKRKRYEDYAHCLLHRGHYKLINRNCSNSLLVLINKNIFNYTLLSHIIKNYFAEIGWVVEWMSG